MNAHEILARNLTASGYGVDREEMLVILNKLSEEDVHNLAYNCHRTSEKLGENAFDSTRLYGETDQ